jgi:tRNA(Ile)-lysidine synthase
VLPSTAQLAELQSQLSACTTRGHQIHMKVGDGFVQRSGAVLAWYNPKVLL